MGNWKAVVMDGVVNGTNRTFTTPSNDPYKSGSTVVVLNGQVLERSQAISGWTETSPSTGEVKLNFAPRGDGICPDLVEMIYTDTLDSVVVLEDITGFIASLDVSGTLLPETPLAGSIKETPITGTLKAETTLIGSIEEVDLSGILKEDC